MTQLSKTFLVVSLLAATVAAPAQQQLPPFQPPDTIDFRTADIYSEGVRLTAELLSLKSNAGKKLPTILMAHGWGGRALSLRRDAAKFAEAGYFVVTFDYRGWGASDGRLIYTDKAPADRSASGFTAKVREIREVVDPVEQVRDWLNALHWLQGEPMCDTSRIGIWGSSYSGGHVIEVAALDPRVKALVSQVGGMDSRFVMINAEEAAKTYDEATRRARGELGYPEPGAQVVGALRGAPIRDKLMHFAPVEHAADSTCPKLIIVAENEELFDNWDHGLKAYGMAKYPKKLVTVPEIKHYGIYYEAREQAQKLAIEWFDQYLK